MMSGSFGASTSAARNSASASARYPLPSSCSARCRRSGRLSGERRAASASAFKPGSSTTCPVPSVVISVLQNYVRYRNRTGAGALSALVAGRAAENLVDPGRQLHVLGRDAARAVRREAEADAPVGPVDVRVVVHLVGLVLDGLGQPAEAV